MAKLSTAKIVGMLSSAKKTGRQVLNAAGEWVAEIVEDFVSGFAGHGWKIWEYVRGKWKLEIDDIVVRGTMTIFELLIQKIRAIKGALGITQACGRIKTAALDSTRANWLITLEDEMSFVAHDFIRCQDWQGGTQKGYWVEISEIRKVDGVDTIVIPVSEFSGGIGYTNGMEAVKPNLSGMTTPSAGDEIVQFGNSVNVNRQSAIYLHADEGGQPAIDILFGIKSKSFVGCVKQRMGGDIPGTDGLKGFYCENGMIKGTDTSGHTVYCIYPDGSAMFGDGSAMFSTNRSGHIAGGAISWAWDASKGKYVTSLGDVVLQWDNLSDEVKENLRGTDANVPEWVNDWDTNKVQIGGEYMISPKLFTGKNTGTASDPILTGILQGDKCITIDGVERSGIFALANNEVVFELDPENGKYKFNGEVNATSGIFKNIKSPNDSFKINAAGDIEIIGKFSTSSGGTRIEISPETNSIKMYNQYDNEVGDISFLEEDWEESKIYYPRVRLRRYLNNRVINQAIIGDRNVQFIVDTGSDSYSCILDPFYGLTFYHGSAPAKNYPAN